MITKRFDVIHTVEVTVDETKFTDEFIQEHIDLIGGCFDLDDHLSNLAYHFSKNNISEFLEVDKIESFLEGYGKLSNFGCLFEDIGTEVDEL